MAESNATCDMCGKESDVLVPTSVDTGESIFEQRQDEDWCPACLTELLTDEMYAAAADQ